MVLLIGEKHITFMAIINHFANGSPVPRQLARRGVALGLAIVVANSMAWGTDIQALDEYQVKAAFIYNFAKFVQWPAEAFQSPTEPIAICVLGQDPFGRSLQDTVAGRVIDRRSLIVRNVSGVKQAAGCHVLFVSSVENKRSSSTLADVKPLGILTIGESDVASADGPIITFKLAGGKVRFDINVEAAERQKLRISSRLLSLAHIVEPAQK